MADDELDEAEGVMPWEDGYVDPAADDAAEPELFTAEQVAAARAEALREAEEAGEAKVRARQSSFDQRQNATQEALRARGLALTADGGVAVSDPKTALQLLMGAASGDQGKKTEEAPGEYDIYDQASVQRFVQAQVQAGISAALEPLKEQYAQLAGVTAQGLQPQGITAARPFLAELGLPDLEKEPEFLDAFSAARSQMPLGSELNLKAMRGAAAFAMSQVSDATLAAVRATAAQRGEETKAQAERDRQREAMMAQGGAPGTRSVSMGGSGAYAGGGGDQAAFDAQILSELSNEPEFDRDLLRAVSAPALKDGRSAVQALQERRAKANGAR